MPTPSPFEGPRRIRRSELRAADRLANICFGPETGTPPEPPGQEPALPGEQETGQTYVIASEGRLVSQICTFQERIHALDAVIRAGCIGGVCTHPQFRDLGLAGLLMEHCTRVLAQSGARIMVISGGRGLYQRLGSIRTGRYAEFTFRPGDLPAPARPLTLRPVNLQDPLPDALLCSRLYASSPVHYRRGVEQFLEAFRTWSPGHNQEQWVVEMDGSAQAYLLLNKDWGYLFDHPEINQRRVYEYGGSPLAVAAAIATALRQPGIEQLDAGIPWQETDLIRLLSEHGARPEWNALDGHTMRIINFPGLFLDLREYVQARLTPSLRRGLRFEQTGPLLAAPGSDGQSAGRKDCGRNNGGRNQCDRCAIVRGSDRLELSVAEMTALVLGASAASVADAAECGVTFAIPQPPFPGALAEIIPALFPLPSFLPGLNYH